MSSLTETLEGYAVDIACIRRYPREELLQRSREHSRQCGLKGHCIESGYGIVDEMGRLSLLEAAATPRVLEAVRSSPKEKGIKLRVFRQEEEGEMKTRQVEEV